MLWVKILNAALGWNGAGQVQSWLGESGAGTGGLGEAALAALSWDVATLRAAFAASHLGRPLTGGEQQALGLWLEDLRLELAGPEPSLAGLALPVLCARRRSPELPEPLETLLGTALVQLLGMAGEARAEARVGRCHGVQRGTVASGFSAEDEARFAVRAGLSDVLRETGLAQCPRLVVAPRRGRYCSKACSNAAFAARKLRREPRYFAAKQDRYRRRRQQSERPAASGAFVYID